MCGRAAIAYAAREVVGQVRNSGVPLPNHVQPPEDYHVGSKSAEEKTKRNPAGKRGVEGWPCVVFEKGEYTVRTLKWGIQALTTHNIWCEPGDEWIERKNWREAIESGRLCAVAVTAFAEGVTCRKDDEAHPLFFLAALYRGSAFVMLTTNAVTVPLLRARAEPQAQHGVPTRCPLYMDATHALQWLQTAHAVPAALAAVRRLESNVRGHDARPRLVLGAKGKATEGDGGGGSSSKKRARGESSATLGNEAAGSSVGSAKKPAAETARVQKEQRERAQADRERREAMEEAELQQAIALSLAEASGGGSPAGSVRPVAGLADPGSAQAPITIETDEEDGSRDGDETEEDEPETLERMRQARLARFAFGTREGEAL